MNFHAIAPLLQSSGVLVFLAMVISPFHSGHGVAAVSADRLAAVAAHDRAIHVLDVWMRDPHIATGSDGAYYLTGTTAEPEDPRWPADRYNAGLDQPIGKPDAPPSIVGGRVRVWRSLDLLDWTELPSPFSLEQGYWAEVEPDAFASTPRADWRLWAPELLWHEGRWIIVHTSPAPVQRGANLAVTSGPELTGPFTHPFRAAMRRRHDPSVFRDDDGTLYLLWGNTSIAPLKPDLSGFSAEPVRIDPSDRIIGHEGATLRKIGRKYVHFGTAWSTDRMRQGSYNLSYCVADSPLGPYGPRQFAGRFLGHGTPFQDNQGRWWCTAFFNGNNPPLSPESAAARDLSGDAYTINREGTTLVPLEILERDGDIVVRTKDPAYAVPGLEEVQEFPLP